MSDDALADFAESVPRKKGRLSSAEARREYQRRYYQLHKEQAKEYQRQYNLTHKKKQTGGRGKGTFTAQREVVKTAHSKTDLMKQPPEKVEKTIKKITDGVYILTP